MKLYPAQRRRRAMASLEYVMVFPFLLGIVCMLYAVARADISRLGAVTVSRRNTWLKADQTKDDNPLAPMQNLQKTQVGQPAPVPVSLGPLLFGGQVQQATSKTTTVADTWGFSTVKFASLPQNCQPHTDVVGRIGSNFVPPDMMSAAFTSLRVFDPTNPAIQAWAPFMSFANLLVQGAGEYLDAGGLVGDFFNAAKNALDAAIRAAEHTPLGKVINVVTGEGIDKLKHLLHKVINALDVFHKLNLAAHGQPVN